MTDLELRPAVYFFKNNKTKLMMRSLFSESALIFLSQPFASQSQGIFLSNFGQLSQTLSLKTSLLG